MTLIIFEHGQPLSDHGQSLPDKVRAYLSKNSKSATFSKFVSKVLKIGPNLTDSRFYSARNYQEFSEQSFLRTYNQRRYFRLPN